MQAAQPVLKNTGGRKDPTPRVQSRFALPVSGRSADFFPGVVRIPPAPPRGVSVPVILAA
jgi:hypothetical protein